MERRSVLDYLDNFLQWGCAPAYIQRRGYRTARCSYRYVAETAFQVARYLEQRGIGKSDRVLMWGPSSAEWVAGFFGCALRGAIVVPIDDTSSPDFAQRLSQQVNPKLLLCSREHVRYSAPAKTLPVLTLEDLQQSVSNYSAAPYEAAEISSTDTLEIVFTFGTLSLSSI